MSGFRLDKYDVTVARFRQFVSAWNNGSGYTPPAGSGKHTHLNGGQGLANGGNNGTYETGWLPSDNANIAPTDANLICNQSYATWTSTEAMNRNTLPISCVNWYEAYAFCIWDGGFLPSEAEWEYAAAGGGEQREYPWGSTPPGTLNQYAIYGCDYPVAANCMGFGNIAPVGTATAGAGAWGQLDLVGNMLEWNLDWWYPQYYVNPCADCAYLVTAPTRTLRGTPYNGGPSGLVPTVRNGNGPTGRYHYLGFRCARSP